MVDRAYREFYKKQVARGEDYWADKTRTNYEVDLWYNKNKNELCLQMLGGICRGKTVLSVGALGWVEKEFLQSIDAKSIIKTDIIGDPKENVIEEDACDLTFADESFDIVICRDLIEHVPNAEQLLSQLRRVLRPNGYLLITTPNLYTWMIDGKSHVRLYSPKCFLQELRRMGFKIVKKTGNIPYILSTIYLNTKLTKESFSKILREFKDIDKRIRSFKDSYYISTQLMVLARKGK